jgi:hypothetical protein
MTTRRPALPPEPPLDEQERVRSLYRAAVKLADNYITFESDVTLPVGASEEQIRAALDTAKRIRQAQAADTQGEIDTMSEDVQLSGGGRSSRYTIRDPEAPASTKQRNAIDRLAASKGWDNTRLVSFCELAGYPLLNLTKGGASWLIDALNGAPTLPPSPATFAPTEPPLPFEPATGEAADEAAAPGKDEIPF